MEKSNSSGRKGKSSYVIIIQVEKRNTCRERAEECRRMYQNILFDLDGTLTNSAEGITNSVVYALKKWNIKVEDKRELYKFIGPPLTDSLKKYYQFSEEESKRAVEYYREYFSVKGLYENEVYDGISDLLAELKRRNKTLILATSKPEEYAVRILKYFHLYDYFDFVAGASMDGTRSTKGDVIRYALESCRICDVSSSVMVGDREYDVLGAKRAGMDSIGVLYGFGNYEELKQAGAVYLAETVEDVLKFC